MGPLAGMQVLDLTSMVSGPVAAAMLADQGADVVKVEPLHGEQMRHLGQPHNGIPPTFFSCNRGKKSIAVNLKREAGQNVLWRLIEQADVLLQNFRPGAMERMGFGAEAVRARNERIIYVSISGFGETGPYADQRVYDPVIQALSGATDIQANRLNRKPEMFRVIIADKVASLTVAQAVSSALFHRERSGEGQHIKLSMLDAMLAFLWPEGMGGLTYEDAEFDPAERSGSMDLIYPTQDGYITAGVISDKEWVGMCRAIKREDLIEDERFSTARARGRNAQIRKEITRAEIAKWPSEEILARLNENDVPNAPLLRRTQLLDNEQIVASDSIARTRYEGFGEVRQARPAARFSRTPSAIGARAPKLGEHSTDILERLGYSEEERRQLIEKGVIVTGENA
ncbi:MAG: CoA transferase [Gammaproteobacteria bacterium]|nr:CoA transferase [Gammaproteobacteria bacterium]MYH46976.1 CoA transferase [Gammaproteobacteria bacterium]MYL13859.1 CoA transferase [Gammaproteobacteria bacterium]